ncbi:MAG: GNAT family N-acetyltransferase [Proteobacteria bacterium]|nr:GNAT family N-acetyltransferase [Pseudomonadota bacterium]
MPDTEVKVRVIRYEDLDDIIDIDAKVLGQTRPEYWSMKVELAEKRSMASLVAEVDGQVVGFILGDASGWEYGVPETIGWIDTIGVLPQFQQKGVARALMTEMVSNLKKVGVEKIYTMVDWRSWDLLKFFSSLGFEKGAMINLELDLAD